MLELQLSMKSISPNNSGRIVVEDCQSISIKSLLEQYKSKLKEQILVTTMGDLDIELAISKTRFGGVRYWFKCPICNRRAGIIYVHPVSRIVGCRLCLKLDYRSRRYKGMVENYLNNSKKIV